MLSLLLPLALAAEPTTLTLDEALARLDAQSPELALARARSDEARANALTAMAPLLPAAQVTGSWLRNDEEVVLSFTELISKFPVSVDPALLPDDITLQPLDAWQATGALRVPLLSVSGIGDATAARAMADSADRQAAAARLALQAGLVQAAALVEAAGGLAEAAAHAEENATRHRDAMKRAVEAGTQPPLALLAAEAELVRRQSDRVSAEADRDRARRALGTLLGMEEPVRVTLPTTVPVEDWSGSPELAAAEMNQLAAHRALWAARLRYAPTLSGTLYGAASTSPFVTGEQTMWKASVDLSWVIFDGAAREGRLAAAAAKARQADAALSAARLQVSERDASAARELEVARQKVGLAETRFNLAREADLVARRGLEAGTVSPLDARDAAQRLVEAEAGLVAARAGEALAAAALRRARGQGW